MLQNTYNLADLVDLALTVPEKGAINFNILHTILKTILSELKISDVKPWCYIDNPINAKAALTKAKLKSGSRSSVSDSELASATKSGGAASLKGSASSEARISVQKSTTLSSIAEESVTDPAETQSKDQDKKKLHTSRSEPQASQKQSTGSEEKASDTQQKSPETQQQTPETQQQTPDTKQETPDTQQQTPDTQQQTSDTQKDNQQQTPDTQQQTPDTQQQTPEDNVNKSTSEEKAVQEKEDEHAEHRERPKSRRQAVGWDEISNELKAQKKSLVELQAETQADKEAKEAEKPKNLNKVRDNWRYTNLDSRVKALDEGLRTQNEVIDMIVDKLKRRNTGGPSSAELEAIEERLQDLEDAREICDFDHDKLEELEIIVYDMQKEFEKIKAIGAEIQQMKTDIASKADHNEVMKALELKADLSYVHTKVDQTEFETAIEELGEAIGLLGIKFQNKNEEWEKRADEIWEGINGKMSRDIFDQYVNKTRKRITAMMMRLKYLKDIVEKILFPPAAGITKCVSCGRPAGVSGHKCIFDVNSPKRAYESSEESENDAAEILLTNIEANQEPNVDGPPYFENKGTRISVPYISSTYNSSTDESDIAASRQMILAPIEKKTQAKKRPQSFKLPPINVTDTPPPERKHVESSQMTDMNLGFKIPHRKLTFTNKKLEEIQKKKETEENEKKSSVITAEVTVKPTKSKKTNISSRSSSPDSSNVDTMSESAKNIHTFAPLRMMQDPLRRDVLLSPEAIDEYKPTMILAPIKSSRSQESSSSEKN